MKGERVEDSFDNIEEKRIEVSFDNIDDDAESGLQDDKIEDSFDNIEDDTESNFQDDKIQKEKVTRDFDLNEEADCGFDLKKFQQKISKMILDQWRERS
ncbi:hypothetical protein GmHk_18G052540 [Glycine max]|nr:hypothetical protein GmHk_18G052540 [Glycine max]